MIKRFIPALLATVLMLSLAGCGTNLFSSFVTNSFDNMQEQIDDLLNNGDYAAAAEAAAQMAASTDPATKQKGYLLLGEAKLAQAGVTPLDIMKKMMTVTTTSNSNMMATLKGTYTPDQMAAMKEAALAYNSAASVNMTSSANSDAQLYRGLTNTMALVNVVGGMFTIGDSTVTSTGNASSKLNTLVNGDSSTMPASYYASNAVLAFASAGGLTADQKETAGKADEVTDEMADLNTAAQNGGSAGGETFTGSESESVKNGKINSALSTIFGSFK